MTESRIKKPFFELGPKLYLTGEKALHLACAADELSEKYGVDIIFTAQYTDLRLIRKNIRHLHLFAQHMDPVIPGRGVGLVLPEALKDAGAEGVLLNHAERPLTLTLVCAGTVQEAAAVACLKPDIILAESPALIGKGKRGPEDAAEIKRINSAVHSISKKIPILHGAGIKDEKDVYEIIKAGADATGSTSGVICADDPERMMESMIREVARAWREREEQEK